MSDLDPTQPQGDAPVATPPAPTAPAVDVEKIKAELAAQFNSQIEERVKGFQRLLNERDEQIRQLQAASLSEEEQEQLAMQEQEQYVADLERKLWLAEKARENATAAELFAKILDAEDPDSQWSMIAELASRQAAQAAQPEPEPESQVPDVDPNNPSRFNPGEEVVMWNGKVLTDEIADQILKGMDRLPGY